MPPTMNRDSPLFRHRQLAPTASIRVSPLCLGTMTFGLSHQERYGECSKADAFAILDHFYAEGGNFIDTANAYQDGESEIWLGEWMASRKNRDQIVLATKYSSNFASQHKDHINSNFVGNGTKSMKLSLEASLRKLQITYIDLFYVHWWDYSISIPELMHSLNNLVVSGKVLYLGISDTPAWVVSKANEYARCHGLRPFSVYQGMWNAACRDFERDIIPMCRDEGMGLAPYGVLNQGRFQTDEGFKRRHVTNPGRKFIPVSERDKQVPRVLERISTAKDVNLLNVALAYVMQKTPYVFPIVGQRKLGHLVSSIAGLTVDLTEDDVQEIEAAYEFDHGFPHTFLSGTLFDGSTSRQVNGLGDVLLTKLGTDLDWVENTTAIRPRTKE